MLATHIVRVAHASQHQSRQRIKTIKYYQILTPLLVAGGTVVEDFLSATVLSTNR